MIDEINLQHLIVEIVDGEALVGGILVSALINRIKARHIAAKRQPPDDYVIGQAVFDLLAAEALEMDSGKRLTVPKPPQPAQKTIPIRGNPSGIYPIGPGDPLYNGHGDVVAIVRGIARDVDAVRRVIGWRMEVDATFSQAQATDGTYIPGRGEILGAKSKKPKIELLLGEWEP